jgi:hypothetical protein
MIKTRMSRGAEAKKASLAVRGRPVDLPLSLEVFEAASVLRCFFGGSAKIEEESVQTLATPLWPPSPVQARLQPLEGAQSHNNALQSTLELPAQPQRGENAR